MPLPTISSYDSDSEGEDVDYVPPDGETSDSEASTFKQGQPSSIPEAALAEEPEEMKRKREALWAAFQASVAHSKPPESSSAAGVEMVKVEKRYRFAGDEVVEVVEVPEDSPEAKKWPLHRDTDAPSLSPATQTIKATPPPAEQPTTEQTSALPNSSTMTSEGQPKTSLSAKHTAGKRPGPRKPKITLASVPNSKAAKKITTLEKSAMDWRAHIQESGSSLKDELEVNRRTGGYLEKVEFLKRVEDRREESLDAMKSNKRRKV